MPWNKPNTTKSNVTPDVKARLKAQQDANKAAQQASIKARREKEDSMTPAEKAKRDRDNMAKATSSSNKGALGATRSDQYNMTKDNTNRTSKEKKLVICPKPVKQNKDQFISFTELIGRKQYERQKP